MTIAHGTRLGPYEVDAPIGAGGMGEVYRARDTRLGRNVAIKILPAELASNAQLRLRFEREAKIVSQLKHPNICHLYDIGESATIGNESLSYIVMELLEGESVADRIARGPIPLDQALRYAIEIADALDRAHHQGIVHRDLKPANVMLTKEGAKLLDFGLAKGGDVVATVSEPPAVDGATEQKPLTREGTILGTLQYMAPEQLEGKEADARTDIFAFGALLYEMVTGRRAFTGKSKVSLIAAILEHDPAPITSLQPLSPPALERLISSCLAKEPDDRWQTAHDVLLQLRWIREGGSGAGIAAPVAARRRHRERTAWIVAIVCLLAMAAFAALWLRARHSETVPGVTTSIVPPKGVDFTVDDQSIALSPDGTTLAFVGSVGGEASIYLRDMRTGTATQLEGTAKALELFWSPDSRNIGFFAEGKLKRISVAGGTPQTLADVETPRGGTWASDGMIVYCPSFRGALYMIPSAGGTPKQITTVNPKAGETNHRWPLFVDDHHLLFLAQRAEGGAHDDRSTIDVLSLDSGKRTALIRANSSVLFTNGYALFWHDKAFLAQRVDLENAKIVGDPTVVAQDVGYTGGESAVATISSKGDLAYFAAGTAPGLQLVFHDRAGKVSGAIAESQYYVNPRVSPDHTRIAYEMTSGSDDIWIYDLVRHTSMRATVDSGDEFSPVWSPDGKEIAYGSNAVPQALWIQSAGGGNERKLWQENYAAPTDWSADGNILVVYQTVKTLWDVGIVSVHDGHFRPLLTSPFNEGNARFSPDGKYIAYMSDRTGRAEVYAQSLESGEVVKVSTDGGEEPIWSRDGREIDYVQNLTLFAVPVRTSGGLDVGEPVRLFDLDPGTRWTRSAYFARNWAYDADAPDRYVVNTPLMEKTATTVTYVQNWLARSKQ